MRKIKMGASVANAEKATTTTEVYLNSLPDDFYPFYDKFHTDSLFQVEHILFPLQGISKSSDSTKIGEKTEWKLENWVLHRPFNSQEGTFKREFTNIGGIITETISANGGLFSLEKRYVKLNNEWHLIYYQELLMHSSQ
ncbi:MAG: hypothetical protein P1U56_24025 [Saprospiraceae bacterium]|nr:hypothetical protein [Saprospiraceae bacterium]